MTYRTIGTQRRWMLGGIAMLFAIIAGTGGTQVAPALAASYASGGYTTSERVSPSVAAAGTTITFRSSVTAVRAGSVLVDVEVYGPSGRVVQDYRDNQTFSAGQVRVFATRWAIPASAAPGKYIVRVGIFAPGWAVVYHWNSRAGSFAVTAPGSAPVASPTAPPEPTSTAVAPRPTATPAPPATGGGAGTGLPPLPSGWPSNSLQLGMADSPGDAASLRQLAPFGFRYQYLSGGVNTGSGWANWNADGAFATNYIQDSISHGMTPVFTYYMIAQSSPGNGQGESTGVYNNLQNASTMTAYFNDVKLFFQRAGAFPSNPVVLHVEPDLWGFIEQRASNDDASTVPAVVASTGLPELAGLPNTFAGFAQGVARLRDRYAPNVLLGYHLSTWGTGNDIALTDPSDATVDALGQKAARFYNSLHANFDLAFSEFSDRDAAFKQFQYGDGGASWWDAGDFAREGRFLTQFVSLSHKRIVMWQIPLGNTKMRAMNNTWDHYQDNRVEWLLDDATRSHLDTFTRAGVIAFLFGRGADGATCACDANGDGVTNPVPVNGNTGTSTSADDDGGFFRQKASAYYAAGAMALPGAGGATPLPTSPAPTNTAVPPTKPTAVPTNTAVPRTTPTATPTPAAHQAPATGVTAAASLSAATVKSGSAVTITARLTSETSIAALVDIEMYDSSGAKVFQRFFDGQSLAAGVPANFAATWAVPVGTAAGTYVVKVGVFTPGWGSLYTWNDAAAQVSVAP